jgi:hypothetical protein
MTKSVEGNDVLRDGRWLYYLAESLGTGLQMKVIITEQGSQNPTYDPDALAFLVKMLGLTKQDPQKSGLPEPSGDRIIAYYA